MSATLRFVTLSLSVVLLVASCGQKGPLRMPEESGPSSASLADTASSISVRD